MSSQVGLNTALLNISTSFSGQEKLDRSSINTLTDKWVRVHVLKLDEHGNPRKLIDPQTNKPTDEDFKVIYNLNTETGDLYLHKTAVELATISTTISLINPFYTAGHVIWNIGRLMIDTSKVAFETLREAAISLMENKRKSIGGILYEGFVEKIIPQTKEYLWNIIKAPIYGVGVQLAALYGIVSPFDGRALLAKIENDWHDGISYKEDLRGALDPQTIGFFDGIWDAVQKAYVSSKVFYEGWCYQIRGNISETHKFKVLKIEPAQYL